MTTTLQPRPASDKAIFLSFSKEGGTGSGEVSETTEISASYYPPPAHTHTLANRSILRLASSSCVSFLSVLALFQLTPVSVPSCLLLMPSSLLRGFIICNSKTLPWGDSSPTQQRGFAVSCCMELEGKFKQKTERGGMSVMEYDTKPFVSCWAPLPVSEPIHRFPPPCLRPPVQAPSPPLSPAWPGIAPCAHLVAREIARCFAWCPRRRGATSN